jgi:calpain-15
MALFHPKVLAPDGKYTITLHHHGQNCITPVVVDDYVPCAPNGMPLFSKPKGHSVWVLLLEKAMAKMFGSYAKLNGNFTAVAFRAFTGESKTFMWEKEGPNKWHKYGFTGSEHIVCKTKLGSAFF